MKLLNTLSQLLKDVENILFPRSCAVCGRRLNSAEDFICSNCYLDLPFTQIRGQEGNVVERLFWEQIRIERASSFLWYKGGAKSIRPVLSLKYNDRPQYGIYFGKIMANDLKDTGFFDGIDSIIPVPLAKKKKRKRGYNQSEYLAKGLSMITGIPVRDDVVRRIIANPTQTRLNAEQRKKNVENIFKLVNGKAIEGKHVLLLDDVITTGATILSCAKELDKVENLRISILSLMLAGKHADVISDAKPRNVEWVNVYE